jgi:Ser/Thr protein kinase RdoA (MazF antagonist)
MHWQRSDRVSEYADAAWAAAPAFGLEPTEINALSHSENVVCELVLGDGQRLVMRLHRPGYNTVAELESEVLWVNALGAAGIPVPTAVPTRNGEYYTAVEIGGQQVQVGVVGWVDGEPLGSPTHAGGPEVVDHYHRIGQLSAAIHTHHGEWLPPHGFVRRRWDAAAFVGPSPLWGRFWEVAALTAEQRDLFSDARSLLESELVSLPVDDDHFGLIHADLHLGNLMTSGDQLTVIDFDDAGFGWFAHDLAVSLHPVLDEPWFDEAKAALLNGYRTVRQLPAEEAAWIDTFLAVRSLMLIGWLDARKEVPVYQHFADIVAQTERVAHQYVTSWSMNDGS